MACFSGPRYGKAMSSSAAKTKRWTAEEYLTLERASPDRHEFFDGEIFAMAGASFAHNLIVSNAIFALTRALGGRCLVLPSDLRIFIPATGLYTYADVSVICGKPEFTDQQSDTVQNPVALVEVLSPSTENYDRGKKFENARTIAHLSDYILVAQDRVLVEHYRRQEGGWLFLEQRAGSRLLLGCGEIDVDDLYRGLFLP